MNAKVLPASAGWQWWKSAFCLLRRAPVLLIASSLLAFVAFYAAIFAGVLVCALIASATFNGALVIGLLFLLAFMLFFPSFFLGLASIFRGVDRGEKASLALFLQPIRERLLPLGALGLLITVFSWIGNVLAFFVSSVNIVDLAQMSTGNIAGISSAVGALGLFFLLNLTIYAVIMSASWFAFFLVGWRNVPILSAVSASFTATLKNWAAFLTSLFVYIAGIIVAGIAGGLLVVAGATFGSILPEWLLAFAAFVLMIAAVAVLIPIIFGFWYFTYKTVFGEETPEPEQAGTASAS